MRSVRIESGIVVATAFILKTVDNKEWDVVSTCFQTMETWRGKVKSEIKLNTLLFNKIRSCSK